MNPPGFRAVSPFGGSQDNISLFLLMLLESGSTRPDPKLNGIGKALPGLQLQLKGNPELAESSYTSLYEQSRKLCLYTESSCSGSHPDPIG